MDREQLAWAAGLFDGEGYVGFKIRARNSYVYRSVLLEVGQNSATDEWPEVLERFSILFELGEVHGPSKWSGTNFFKVYTQSHQKVQYIACCLWPWLSNVKKEQFARTLIRWNQSGPITPRKGRR